MTENKRLNGTPKGCALRVPLGAAFAKDKEVIFGCRHARLFTIQLEVAI